MAGDSPAGAGGVVPSTIDGRSRDLLAVEHAEDTSVPSGLLVEQGKKASAADKKNAPPAKPLFTPSAPSALLSRLHSFLPEMAAANDTLAAQMKHGNSGDFDVENVGDDPDTRHVEMDVGVGVLDFKSDADAESAARSAGVVVVDLDDGDEGSEETRGRRKRIKEAREDRSITIPGLDEPETGVKNPGIEEL